MRTLLAVLALAACAHTPDLPLRPDPAPPAGSTTWTFDAADGTHLLARAWIGVEQPRGVVVIMHGLKDDSGRYAGFAAALVARGYRVYAFDLRGNARSAGPRVDPHEWTDYVGDLARFLDEVARREPGHPIFLFGHSMGGAIAARTAEVHPGLAGLILSGAALAVDAPPLLLAFTRMAGTLTPGLGALKLPNKDFSSDPAAAAIMDRDPLIEQGASPASLAAGLIDGMHLIWQDADALKLPVLALHGGADTVTAPWGSRALVDRIPAADKRLQIYDGYFHDLLHEPGDRGPHVQADVLAWLDAHTGGAPLPAAPPPPPELAGRPRGWLQRIDLAAGVLRVDEGGADGPPPETQNLFAARVAVDLARPRTMGWFGSLRGDFGRVENTVALRPVGVGFASEEGWTHVGVSGGIAVGELAGDELTRHVSWAAGAVIDQALPFLHLTLFVDYCHTIHLDAHGYQVAQFGGTLRLPGDRTYWPTARAGVGPALTVARECVDTGTSGDWGCATVYLLGMQWFGSD